MKKKVLTIMLAGMMGASLLAGCGGAGGNSAAQGTAQTAQTTEQTPAAADTAKTTEQTPAAADTAKTTEQTPAAADTAQSSAATETSSALTFKDLQDNYAILLDCYNQVEELYMSDQIEKDEEIENLLTEAKSIIDEMGNATEADFSSEQDLQTMNDSMVTMIDSLDKIVDGMTISSTEGSAAGSETDVIGQLKSKLTLGYAGASESGEELYFATDENVDVGILGIVNGTDATFLAGDITESNGELTITDSQTGDTLSFTTQEDKDDEGTPVLILNVTSNGAVGALYAADASDVIDAMAKY